MTAHEILTEELETRYGTTATWAQHILDALKAAGFAVVELSGPEGMANYGFRASPGRVIDELEGYVHTVSKARGLAAALLAAADLAEGSTPTEAA